jgi:hypothetical protein
VEDKKRALKHLLEHVAISLAPKTRSTSTVTEIHGEVAEYIYKYIRCSKFMKQMYLGKF